MAALRSGLPGSSQRLSSGLAAGAALAVSNMRPMAFRELPSIVGPRLGRFRKSLSGITRDSANAPLASCVCDLFLTATDVKIGTATSDADGNYDFPVYTDTGPLYVVAYKSAILFTDDFHRANSTNLGPNWNEFGTGLAILSNQLWSDISASNAYAEVLPLPDLADVEISFVYGSGFSMGVVVRDIPSGLDGYSLFYDFPNTLTLSILAGIGTPLQVFSIPTLVSGDIVTLRAVGSALTALVNGVALSPTVIDSTIPGPGRCAVNVVNFGSGRVNAVTVALPGAINVAGTTLNTLLAL